MILYIFFSISLFFQHSCKKDNCGNNEENRSSIRFQKKSEELTINESIYYFDGVSDDQLFPIKTAKEEIVTAFSQKRITIIDDNLNYSNCSSKILIRKKASNEYFNGKQNVSLYNEILDKFKIKIESNVDYIELLYPENNCNLPSENYFLLKDKLLFVYKGYIILFSKKTKGKAAEDTALEKLSCGDTTGNMETGFVTKCFIKDKITTAYSIFMQQSEINEIKYLRKEIPKKNESYENNEAQVEYEIEPNRVLINIYFAGGITTMEFKEKSQKTEIKIINSPD